MTPRRDFTMMLVLCAACALPPAWAGAGPNAVGGVDTFMGRRVETLTVRQPAAKVCVVFENGLRATVDGWRGVIDRLPPEASVFAYNRPGYGQSEKTDTPRDGGTVVEELRQLLRQKGMQPPYILVGHSLGGLYMQLFARRYPGEVAGLVLVDAVYPGAIKKPEDFPLLTRAAKGLFFSNTVNREVDNIHRTGEQVAALATIDDKPVIQMVNRPTGATAIPVDFGVVDTDPRTAARIRTMYPKATTIFLDSDHQMQQQDPAAVADAIRTLVAGVVQR